MKKKLFIALIFLNGILAFSYQANSQTFKASVYYGSAETTLVVVLRPDFDFNDKITEVGFTIQVPKVVGGFPIQTPIITTLNNFIISTFPIFSFVPDVVSDPDYFLFKVAGTGYSSSTAPVISIANGNELKIVELSISAPAAAIPLTRLAHMAAGGPGSYFGVAFYDQSGADRTNYHQMFFGLGVVPASPIPDESDGYNTYQYVLPSSTLPVKFSSFSAIKRSDDGMLNWTAENETNLTDRYEIERSLNGRDFNNIGTMAPKNNGIPGNSYDFIDRKLSSVDSKGVLYYRIKQIDKDGKFVYTDIKSIRLDGKTFDVSIYPNPIANNSGNLYIDMVNDEKINIMLFDASGKILQTGVINGLKGLNTYTLNMSNMSKGTYMVKVIAGTHIKTIPIIKN